MLCPAVIRNLEYINQMHILNLSSQEKQMNVTIWILDISLVPKFGEWVKKF